MHSHSRGMARSGSRYHTNLFIVVEPTVKLLAVSTCSDRARLLHRFCCCMATYCLGQDIYMVMSLFICIQAFTQSEANFHGSSDTIRLCSSLPM